MIEKIRSLISLVSRRRRKSPQQKVHVIVNPASGRNHPVLKILNTELQKAQVDWEVLVTKQAGDALQRAQEAVRAKVDRLVVYGGDGTIMEAASGLFGSDIPLAVLPGGTGNLLALELGIPNDLSQACSLAFNPQAAYREVDIGRISDRYFLVRVGMGIEQAMIEGADREAKDRLGPIAYALSVLQSLANPPSAHYSISIDGNEVESDGLTCILANVGNMGKLGYSLAPSIRVDDGLLDVLVIRQVDLISLLSMFASVVRGDENAAALQHWQGREITVRSDPVQKLQIDGEVLGETPVTVKVVPRAIRFVVPAPADSQGSGNPTSQNSRSV